MWYVYSMLSVLYLGNKIDTRYIFLYAVCIPYASILTSNDDTEALGVVLRASSAAEHLHDIQRAQLLPGALLGAVHLRALDDHHVRRQIHAPCQGGCRYQHLRVQSGIFSVGS